MMNVTDSNKSEQRSADRPVFTQDWFSSHVPLWRAMLEPLRGKPVTVLEIGVFEGLSTLWLLENILTDTASSLVYVDTFDKR